MTLKWLSCQGVVGVGVGLFHSNEDEEEEEEDETRLGDSSGLDDKMADMSTNSITDQSSP